jgi:BMFP domain-containing protein YqiC
MLLCTRRAEEDNSISVKELQRARRTRATGAAPASGASGAPMHVDDAYEEENGMLNSKVLDELAARIGRAFENSPAKDIEKNVKALLQSGLSRLDFVSREDFDVQVEVLRKTREKVERLEARVAELEARTAPPPPPPPQPVV